MSAEPTPRSDQPESEERSPVITLPEDSEVRGRLWFKLRDYRTRVDEFRHPSLRTHREWDAEYKIRVLMALFEKGEVATFNIAREVEAQYDGVVKSEFNNACAVIEHYCQTEASALPTVQQCLAELEDLGEDEAKRVRQEFDAFQTAGS